MRNTITTLAAVTVLGLGGLASAQSVTPNVDGGGYALYPDQDLSVQQTYTPGNSGAESVGTPNTGAQPGANAPRTGTSSGGTMPGRAGTSTIRVPNTGAGGDAQGTIALLTMSAIIAAFAGSYALKAKRA